MALVVRRPIAQEALRPAFAVRCHLLPRHARTGRHQRIWPTSMIAHCRQLEGGGGTDFRDDTHVTSGTRLPHHNVTQLRVLVIATTFLRDDVTHSLSLGVGTSPEVRHSGILIH